MADFISVPYMAFIHSLTLRDYLINLLVDTRETTVLQK